MTRGWYRKTCERTGKRRFKTKLDAEIAAASAHSRGRDDTRAYLCPTCKCWHLTGQAKRSCA